MPEGDTILRTARALNRALGGKTVARFESVLPALLRVDDETPLRGRTIERVTAQGKHLLIEFSGDLVLRTHMRMSGSWHLYRTGERWRQPRSAMRVIIATNDFEAVGFSIPVADFHHGGVKGLESLGPDILTDAFDADLAHARIREHDGEEIGNVLLDQRVIAGIGNIYKSEALFAAKTSPFARVGSLDDASITRIVKKARGLMRRAADGPRGRWSVYERGGEPCRLCGTKILYRKQGAQARGTYWCPKCQGRIDGHDAD